VRTLAVRHFNRHDLHDEIRVRTGASNLKGKPKMITARRTLMASAFAMAAALLVAGTSGAQAASADDLNRDSAQALRNLTQSNRMAADISHNARAVLVFPNIVKAGLVFGGAYGEGTMMKAGRVTDYYNSVTGSWGLQAGAQSYGYVVFLMNNKAVDYVDKSSGWEIGVGPTVVIVDEGAAKNLSTSTLKDDAYAFIFNQQGLMAGVSIEGTKISRINRGSDKHVER
jgi:lipid-binding SYLF domain-containing protein